MSQCIVPNWNLNHQRQEQGEADQERNRRSSPHPHVHSDRNLTYVVPMANYEVTELTWENGQLALHGLGGMVPQAKQTTTSGTTWEKPGDHTLESIVHQATFPIFHQNQAKNPISPKMGEISSAQMHIDPNQEGNGNLITSVRGASSAGKWRPGNSGQAGDFEQNLETSMGSMAASAASGGKWRGNLGHGDGGLEIVDEERVSKLRENPELVNKRIKMWRRNLQAPEERAAASACASASATFCRDHTDTTMMTWNSFESPMSLKSGRMNGDDDSACHLSNSENREGERRRSRAAAIHNQSERRRRDRINEKMRALQKLVPNASKTDKASMLDEVIEYLKQLQAQVQMMGSARNMAVPQIMHMGMLQQQQQQQQMSLLAARMGMGIGMGMGMGRVPGMPMGMFDVNTMAQNVHHSLPPIIHGGGAAPSSFVSPPFAMPPVIPNHGPPQLRPNVADHHASISNFNDAYQSFLAQQSMNLDFFNKMAALYRQQATQQTSKKPVNSAQANNGQAE